MSKILPLVATLLTFGLTGLARAQIPPEGGAVVSGIVQTAEGTSLSSALVVLHRPGDTIPAASSITATNGAFRIDGVAPGSYAVEVSHLGFESATRSDVTITGPTERVDLGIIRLEPSAIALQDVEVSAARSPIVMLPDRNVYSTADMPAAVGGTATDVLRSVPELEVSVDGRVSAQGATPTIHINGRPAPMQGEALDRYLQQLPGERIDRIEVISNPSARYEAQGQGGIVNIVMKEGVSLGLSGSLVLNAGTRNQRGGSGNITYQRGNVTLFGGASVSFFGNDFESSDVRQNLNVQPVTSIQQVSRNHSSGGFGSVDLTAEVKAGSRGTFWTEFGIGRSTMDADAVTAYTHLDPFQNPIQRYDRVNDADFRGVFRSAVVGFRAVAEPQRSEWSVELRRNFNGDDNASASARHWVDLDDGPLGLPPERLAMGGGNDQNGLSLQADLMRAWGEDGHVELGYRGSWAGTDDRFRVQFGSPPNPSAEDEFVGDFQYRERIHAGFVTVNRQFARVRVQLGIRAEQADVRTFLLLEDETFETRYRSIFPSANISTRIGTGAQLRLSYSKRIERPGAWDLNPHTPELDPLNRQVGNPHLMPEHTHSLSVAFSQSVPLGTVQLSPYYRRTVDGWDQIRMVDEAGVSTVTWQNLATVTSYGGRLSASIRQLGPVGGAVSVSGYREVRDASNLSEDFSGAATRFSVSSNISVRASSAFHLQSSLSYLPARHVPQGKISPLVFSTLGARLRLLDGRGSINVSAVDPFALQRLTFTTRDKSHVQTGSSTLSARRATFSFSYSFGRPPESNRRDRTPEERDQQGQVQRIR